MRIIIFKYSILNNKSMVIKREQSHEINCLEKKLNV